MQFLTGSGISPFETGMKIMVRPTFVGRCNCSSEGCDAFGNDAEVVGYSQDDLLHAVPTIVWQPIREMFAVGFKVEFQYCIVPRS